VSDGNFKALLWVHHANHNQFNTTWPTETPGTPTLTRAEQEQVAKVQFGALAAAVLLDRSDYRAVLRDHAAASAWMPPRLRLRVAVPGSGARLPFAQSRKPQRAAGFLSGARDRRRRRRCRLPAIFRSRAFVRPQKTITLQLSWNAATAKLLPGNGPRDRAGGAL